MLKTTYTLFFVLSAALMLAGCAGSREAARTPHPLVGAWDYSIDTPQGIYTGVLTFAETEDVLTGTIEDSTQPGEAPLQKVAFDGSVLTFDFDSGEYGMMSIKVTVDGDAFNGSMLVQSFGAEVPFQGTRQASPAR